MKVTIVGCGGLGAALAHGLVGKADLTLVDRHPEKLAPFAGAARVLAETELLAGVADADVVIACVKPKGTRALAAAIEGSLRPDALLVSCAAGIEVAGLRAPVARAMPSIGAAKGASTTAVFLGPGCVRPRDSQRLAEVFGAVGVVREVPDEGFMHLATAIAASGPAFLLLAVEALVDGGLALALPREDALAFAAGALRAAAARLEEGVEPSALRAQVTSPNGTTAAGLAVLEGAGVRAAFVDAVRAAVVRSRELSG